MTVQIDGYQPFQAGRPKLIKYVHHDGTDFWKQVDASVRFLQRVAAERGRVYRLQMNSLYSPSLGVAKLEFTTPRDKVTTVNLLSPRVQDRLWTGAVNAYLRFTYASGNVRLICRNGGFMDELDRLDREEETE